MIPIYLVVGPPAVGKSTTSRALAAHFPQSIHIPVDDLREMVVSGLVLPGPKWSDELALQVCLARHSAMHSALEYHDAGFVVVIDDFWDGEHISDYAGLLDHPDFHKVVLLPKQEVAHQRNFIRSEGDPSREYIDQGIDIVYAQLSAALPRLLHDGWLVVDTGTLGVDQTVNVILQKTLGHKNLIASAFRSGRCL